MSTELQPERLKSLDQFRGYSVAAMFVVNFLGGMTMTHQLLRHNNTHFSYADSIMPSFLFACGFSYRLSFLKQLEKLGETGTGVRFIKRSLGLILLSMMLYGFNSKIVSWSEISVERATRFVLEWLKADLWEVLAIIGAIQIVLLPWIARGTWTRVLVFLVFGLLHAILSWLFNYEFVYGRPNGMDGFFGATGKRAWDGGCFGLIAWAQIMLAGTLAFDALKCFPQRKAIGTLFTMGAVLMLAGYALLSVATLYNLEGLSEEQSLKISSSPVVPDFSVVQGRSWDSFLAEPPFVPPPPPAMRAPSYWAMDKRVVTQSFVLFSTGFAFALFGCFVVACDSLGFGLRVFEMFGKNPLASYIIHHFVTHTLLAVVPKDSPLLWCLIGLAMSFGITYLFVRFLESRNLYLRL